MSWPESHQGNPQLYGAGYMRLRQAFQVAYFTDGHNSKSELWVVRSYPCESVRYTFSDASGFSGVGLREGFFRSVLALRICADAKGLSNSFLFFLPANQFDVASSTDVFIASGPGAFHWAQPVSGDD